MSLKLLPAKGVPIYASASAFGTGSQGELAVAQDTNTLYEFNGTTWVPIASAGGFTAVADTNSIDLSVNTGTVSADLNYQDTNEINLGVDANGLKANLNYVDTNTVDIVVGASGLSANVKYQDSSSVNLSDDTSGLKADVLISATGTASSNRFKAYPSIKADGLFVEVADSDVTSRVLTGYVAATGSVSNVDTIETSIEKLGYYVLTHDEAQVVTVAKSGGHFTDPQLAIDSITDATSSKIYAVEINPGTYTGNITLKPFVYLVSRSTSPTSVVIAGKVTASFGALQNTWLQNLTVRYTAASDGDKAIDVTGGIVLDRVNVTLSSASDYALTAVSINSTTVGSVLLDCSIAVSSMFDGSSKSITAVDVQGNQSITLSRNSVGIVAKASSAAHYGTRIRTTGCMLYNNNEVRISNTKAGFNGSICGTSVDSASTDIRIAVNNYVSIIGTGNTGTATGYCLDSSSASGDITHVNPYIYISGFATENASNTATTDNQKLYSASTNKALAKAGVGLSSITPFDLLQSGFIAWDGSGNYYSFVPGTRVFTLLRSCIGMVKGTQVYIIGGVTKTVTLTNFANNFIYGDSSGNLGVTTDPSFDDKVFLFSVYTDGTYFRVSKQTHPVSFPAAVSGYAHNALGSTLKNDANGILEILSATGRSIKCTGDTTYYDHGLNTTVADNATGISMKMMYTGASGATFQGSAFTTIPAVRQNGTTLSNVSNGKFVNYRIGVFASNNIDDTTPNQVAQFLIVPDSTEHNSASAAADQVTANTVAAFPTAASGGLEVINIGFATLQGNGSGGGSLTTVTPKKQVFGVNFASGSSSSAGTVLTDTSTFDKNLSATDTSVQLALQTFDEFSALPNNATNASASPDLTNKTAFASAATGTSCTITFDSRGAIEFLLDVNTDGGMTIACDYKSTVINALSDPSGLFLATDAGTGIYITKSANSAVITVKNRMAATKTIGVLAIRSNITAATAWS